MKTKWSTPTKGHTPHSHHRNHTTRKKAMSMYDALDLVFVDDLPYGKAEREIDLDAIPEAYDEEDRR